MQVVILNCPANAGNETLPNWTYRTVSVNWILNARMDLAATKMQPQSPMALGHRSASTDYTDAPSDRLSPACATSRDDFGTKPNREGMKPRNRLISIRIFFFFYSYIPHIYKGYFLGFGENVGKAINIAYLMHSYYSLAESTFYSMLLRRSVTGGNQEKP